MLKFLSMNKLIILAYNEELYIEQLVKDYLTTFDEIIIINDKSKDNTYEILDNAFSKLEKVKIIHNKRNYGAGKSFQIGIAEALKSKFNYLVKIDGDNQFEKEDIFNLIKYSEKEDVDYIKCDRFWTGGIQGEIPKIRYFGNAIASILIKFVTSNNKINDPLNGLFLFSFKAAEIIEIPRMFKRYGYPFYINYLMNKQSYVQQTFNLKQYKNIVKYGNQRSNLNAVVMFFKLLFFSFWSFGKQIFEKLKISNLQISGLQDIFALTSLLFSIFCFVKVISIRYFSVLGNQGAWVVLSILLLFSFLFTISISRKQIEFYYKESFSYLN